MSEPMKIRALMKGDIADIRILMRHVNETGLRKEAGSGKLIPAHYIQAVTVEVAGKRGLEGQTNITLSSNPVLACKVQGVIAGDRVVVTWTDNHGEHRTDESILA